MARKEMPPYIERYSSKMRSILKGDVNVSNVRTLHVHVSILCKPRAHMPGAEIAPDTVKRCSKYITACIGDTNGLHLILISAVARIVF